MSSRSPSTTTMEGILACSSNSNGTLVFEVIACEALYPKGIAAMEHLHIDSWRVKHYIPKSAFLLF